MRILLVTHLYPPFGVAGVERVAEQTALALTAAGDEVTVLTRRESAAPPIPKLERMQRHGIEIVLLSGGGPLHGRFPKHAPVLERLFERTLLEFEPDVVLISHLMNHSPGYVSIARRWNVPVIFELHDYYAVCERARLERRSGELCRGPEGGGACAVHCFPEQPQASERWALRSHMFRHAIEQADALLAPSRFAADYFLELFGSNLPALHVVGNGVDAKRLETASRAGDAAISVAYIGAVVEHKGVHVLVDALRRARLPKARLTLFGVVTQPYFGDLLEAVDQIDNLEFRAFGAFDPADLPVLLGDVDIVVVPSLWWETYSIVVREAFACGIPVIASRLGALPEAVRHGENGLLFDAGSGTQLATILQMLDSDRDQLKALRNGIRATDWISVQERTSRLRAVMAEVLADRPATPAPISDFAELSILRDGLVEVSPAA
jgi:glycosyltransferase involved in cell wall biosynthesis